MSTTSRTRRAFVGGAAALGGLALLHPAFGTEALRAAPLAKKKAVRISWLPMATCVAPVPVAAEQGFFDKYNLNVELKNYEYHGDDMLASPVTGASDAVVTMIHNLLIPVYEKNLPLKFVTPVHGGCIYLMGRKSAGVPDIGSLRGKRLGVAGGRLAELSKIVFRIILLEHGLRPEDVTLVPIAGEDYASALLAGQIDAAAGLGAGAFALRRAVPDLVEIATNMSGPMAGRTCCVMAVGPALWRDDPLTAAAMAGALADASAWVAKNPEGAARIFEKHAPYQKVDLVASFESMNYHAHHGANLRDDVAMYVNNLKEIGVFSSQVDPLKFADTTVQQVICS